MAAAPRRQWGTDLEAGAVEQMRDACALPPVAVRGALMTDAHQGYGLPIGVEAVASFQPRIVKMAPAGERPED